MAGNIVAGVPACAVDGEGELARFVGCWESGARGVSPRQSVFFPLKIVGDCSCMLRRRNAGWWGDMKPKRKENPAAEAPAKAGAVSPVVVLSLVTGEGVEIAERKYEMEFKVRAAEVIAATALTGEKYLSLCRYIRERQLSPVCVSLWMGQCGFQKPRIAEVQRVAFCNEDVWSAYEARSIGWKKALEGARAGGLLRLVSGNPEAAAQMTIEYGAAMESLTPPEGELRICGARAGGEPRKGTLVQAVNRKAAGLLALVTKMVRKGKPVRFDPWNVGNGFELVLRKAQAVTTDQTK